MYPAYIYIYIYIYIFLHESANENITYRQLRDKAKVTAIKVWTIGRMRNCLDTHLGQIVCDKDGVVDWCIVLVEMPLTRFEECWPLPTESLLEIP